MVHETVPTLPRSSPTDLFSATGRTAHRRFATVDISTVGCAMHRRFASQRLSLQRYSGDFSKRISLITLQKPDGSEYPTWATQDGVPSGSRPPAWLFAKRTALLIHLAA